MLSQFRVLVDDFPASFAFYRDVLDLKPQEGHPETGPYGCFKGEGTDIALLDRAVMAASLGVRADPDRGSADHPSSNMDGAAAKDRGTGDAFSPAPRSTAAIEPRSSSKSPDHAVLVFRVDDVDAAYENATARGAIPAGAPKEQPGWGMRVAHVRAPEGTLIEFCSYG